MVLSELKNYQIAVKDKRAPAVLHTQDPQLVPPPPPQLHRPQDVFLIQDVKWTDASKQLAPAACFHDVLVAGGEGASGAQDWRCMLCR